jgi:hypothetical protein
MQVHLCRQVLAQQLDTLCDQASVIGIEGRTADAPREFHERNAADLKAIVNDRELRRWRMSRARLGHGRDSNNICNPCGIRLRWFFAIGIRGVRDQPGSF